MLRLTYVTAFYRIDEENAEVDREPDTTSKRRREERADHKETTEATGKCDCLLVVKKQYIHLMCIFPNSLYKKCVKAGYVAETLLFVTVK